VAERVGIIRRDKIVEVAGVQTLIHRSMRRVRIQFRHDVDPAPLLQVPGVALLKRDDGRAVTLQVEGEMDGLLKAVAAFPVVDFETERPSLEEIFLAYYEDERNSHKTEE
jgi:ABC-2 type transport system ATP-binding protein